MSKDLLMVSIMDLVVIIFEKTFVNDYNFNRISSENLLFTELSKVCSDNKVGINFNRPCHIGFHLAQAINWYDSLLRISKKYDILSISIYFSE